MGAGVSGATSRQGTRMVAEVGRTETRMDEEASAARRRKGDSVGEDPATTEVARRHEVIGFYPNFDHLFLRLLFKVADFFESLTCGGIDRLVY